MLKRDSNGEVLLGGSRVLLAKARVVFPDARPQDWLDTSSSTMVEMKVSSQVLQVDTGPHTGQKN